jgi:NCAIR mutase (PurE)-related protein
MQQEYNMIGLSKEFFLDREQLLTLLKQVKQGKMDVGEAFRKLKNLPYEDLGFAKLDHHRSLRRGYPETVFCQNKSLEQVKEIIKALAQQNHNILATRANIKVYTAVKEIFPEAEYFGDARIIFIERKKIEQTKSIILVVTAGTADLPVAEEAAVTAEKLGNTVERLYDVGVSGIHRLLLHREKIERAGILIIAAGMDGVLPSVIAGLVDKPVIAVPTSVGYGASFNGLAALLTMLNSCASGVLVVNIDNGYGAGYAASLINRLAEKMYEQK